MKTNADYCNEAIAMFKLVRQMMGALDVEDEKVIAMIATMAMRLKVGDMLREEREQE